MEGNRLVGISINWAKCNSGQHYRTTNVAHPKLPKKETYVTQGSKQVPTKFDFVERVSPKRVMIYIAHEVT